TRKALEPRPLLLAAPPGVPTLAFKMASAHKMSYSNHEIYHKALKWTKLFVNIGMVYGTLLLAGAVDVLGPYWVILLGLREG
ncbi:unnamed protein product, partial [Laminaria digitata]